MIAAGLAQRGVRLASLSRLALLLAAFALTGCITIARESLPGRTASLDPFVDCRGTTSDRPTVFLQAGAYSTSADWDLVIRDLSQTGRVCAYDRLGLGLSPDRRSAPTAERIARNLATLLDRMDETRPIILVGHSNGAFYVETFAILQPERVAGLVYVDGIGTDHLDEPAVVADLQSERTEARLAALGGRFGLAWLFVQARIEAIGLDGRAAAHTWRAMTSARHLRDARDEVLAILPALRRMTAKGQVPISIPVVSIVATANPRASLDRAWRAAQAAPTMRACQGWLLEAVGASHVSPLGRDRAYILAAIRWLETPGLKSSTSCAPAIFKR